VESTAAQRVGVRELLEAGVHFGHQAKRWNPKMKRYIFAERAGVHIIDLDQTLTLLEKACDFVRGVAEAGREVLFVGTKKQAQITIADQALRSGQPYVAERYIGGMLTNFQTIQPRIEFFKRLAARVEETPPEEQTGKDWFALTREYQKLRRNFAGITEMERLPGAVFVVDPKREELLVKEANRLRIPVVGLTDTNCDPEVIDYVIPGNDDAIRSINLISRLIADSILEGKGEGEVHPEDRPVPPVVEETRVQEQEVQDIPSEDLAAANAGARNGASAEPAPKAAPEAAPEAAAEAAGVEAASGERAETRDVTGGGAEVDTDAEVAAEGVPEVAGEEGTGAVEPAGGEPAGGEPDAGEAGAEDENEENR
jgi:small subunit ribosomal protein S2